MRTKVAVATAALVGLCTIATVTFASNPPVAEAQGSWLRSTIVEDSGDVDCDGAPTEADSADLLAVLAGLLPGAQSCGADGALGANLGRSDLDLDGVVSVRDALIMAQCASSEFVLECQPEPLVPSTMGDVNCDGRLDDADAVAIESLRLGRALSPTLCIGGDTTLDLSRGDLTNNGAITSADAFAIRVCIDAHANPHQKGRVDECPRTGTEAAGRLGDVNCDAIIDEADVAALTQYLAGDRPGVQSCAADPAVVANLLHSEIDGDGLVTPLDAVRLESCLVDHDRFNCASNTANPPFVPPPDYDSPTMGDVNCDGVFDFNDAADAATMVQFGLRSIVGCDSGLASPTDPSRGDLDADGALSAEDVGLLFECSSRVELDECPGNDNISITADIDRNSPAIGDANCDGARTIADVAAIEALIADAAALSTESCSLGATGRVNRNRSDVNGDNLVTLADAQALEQCLDDPTGTGCPPVSCGAAEATAAECSYENRILSLRFLPRDPVDPTLLDPWAMTDGDVANGIELRIDELLQDIERFETEGVPLIENATRYRGWADPSAQPAVRLSIDTTTTLYERPPLGLDYLGTPRPDYIDILERPDIDICNLVDNQGIDEVWMWSMHTERIQPVESNFSSRIGTPFVDISNSERSDDLPHCSRSYVLYNFNFLTGSANMLHNRGHHVEAWLSRQFRDRQAFVFDGYTGEGPGGYETLAAPLGFYRCGNVHRSVNSPAIALPGQPEENNWVDRIVASDCEDWARTGGRVSAMNCDDWFRAMYDDPTCFNDGGASWVSWWFQNLPGIGNGLIDEGQQWRNLHMVIGDPDALLSSSTFLYETEQLGQFAPPVGRFGVDRHHITHDIINSSD